MDPCTFLWLRSSCCCFRGAEFGGASLRSALCHLHVGCWPSTLGLTAGCLFSCLVGRLLMGLFFFWKFGRICPSLKGGWNNFCSCFWFEKRHFGFCSGRKGKIATVQAKFQYWRMCWVLFRSCPSKTAKTFRKFLCVCLHLAFNFMSWIQAA